MVRPFFGYGFDVEGQVLHNPKHHLFMRTESYYLKSKIKGNLARLSLHNGYLSVLVGTGLLGFIIWLYLLFCPFILIMKLSNNPEYFNFKNSVLMMMIMALGLNFAEYCIDGGKQIYSIQFWILWTVLLKVSKNSSYLSTKTARY